VLIVHITPSIICCLKLSHFKDLNQLMTTEWCLLLFNMSYLILWIVMHNLVVQCCVHHMSAWFIFEQLIQYSVCFYFSVSKFSVGVSSLCVRVSRWLIGFRACVTLFSLGVFPAASCHINSLPFDQFKVDLVSLKGWNFVGYSYNLLTLSSCFVKWYFLPS